MTVNVNVILSYSKSVLSLRFFYTIENFVCLRAEDRVLRWESHTKKSLSECFITDAMISSLNINILDVSVYKTILYFDKQLAFYKSKNSIKNLWTQSEIPLGFSSSKCYKFGAFLRFLKNELLNRLFRETD